MHTPSVYLFLRMHTPSVYLFLSLHTTCCRACIDSPCPQLMLPVVEPQTTAHMDIDSEEASVPWHLQLMAIGETSFTMLHHASPSFTICYHSSPSDTICHHCSPCSTKHHHYSPCVTILHHLSPSVASTLAMMKVKG